MPRKQTKAKKNPDSVNPLNIMRLLARKFDVDDFEQRLEGLNDEQLEDLIWKAEQACQFVLMHKVSAPDFAGPEGWLDSANTYMSAAFQAMGVMVRVNCGE